jgi:D-arabinose 5-phosphate isomerase GutQ
MKTILQALEESYGSLVQQQADVFDRIYADDLILPEESAWGLVAIRTHAISHAVAHTCVRNHRSLSTAVDLFAEWMREKSPVRIIGAGRALWSASMPGNRLAHGGARVSFVGGMVPLPNSVEGGGIIACSASGKTVPVLQDMQTAKKRNPQIKILGLAKHDATEFRDLCDCFIGIHVPKIEYPTPISALADTEEFAISLILDAIVVLAGRKLGLTDEHWRTGHEDIGPTGPYSPIKPTQN